MDEQHGSITYLPQRQDFVMVDRVLTHGEADAVVQFVVRPDNLLLDGDQLTAAGIIENMAQSCASTMRCISANNEALQGLQHDAMSRIWTIGDIKQVKILRYPRCNEVLNTHVRIVLNMYPLMMTAVETHVGDEIIATARIALAMTAQEAN
ncbi:MAG: hypothetical protein IKS64_02550 [Muribaculaceae bacterium]|nr:hypothetical protein [Muribaculaceae bacterium]MBR6431707.1 hypothetical protein [Muribaculaceae bacterium]